MEPIQPTPQDADPWAPRRATPEEGQRPRSLAPAGIPDYVMQYSAALSAVAPVAAIFGKAFLESLAKRSAEGVVGLPGKLRQRRLRRGHKGNEVSIVLDIENGSAAAILVTADLPDEARLALIDLDPAAPGLQGKVLGWDSESQQWAPVETPTDQHHSSSRWMPVETAKDQHHPPTPQSDVRHTAAPPWQTS